ncbi:MAG: NHLP bacteriocin export ABC transporter permease/ATPase subunit [Chloroflexi bacterium]|nr:NHLP bacteriocin export ABC transporter permease/ATPase subunit [Chloroflexota bacterium]MCI0576022.1 NHLP bacteriocin export ABC transporter permease/ATPase subunit [Chloroflexota bacterium]MCI0645146.1 NHLP bacteriocin export ABC transporter permease/ATPase subunit [Chloroflexota bacterium]MCI0725626.1 NHLP bacteriocin export ABC transporter permease/ATPase subunit [Chloroflexota bacterium]
MRTLEQEQVDYPVFPATPPKWRAAGKIVEAGSNRPLLLVERDTFWVVVAGKVDIFAIPIVDGQPAGARHHLFRAEAGQALFSVHSAMEQGVGLLAVGAMGTELLVVEQHQAEPLVRDFDSAGQLVRWLDDWITNLTASTTTVLPPKDCTLLEAATSLSLPESARARPRRGVVWIKHMNGASWWLDRSDLPALGGKHHWPISGAAWVQAITNSELTCDQTKLLVRQGILWPSLQQFHGLIIECVRANMAQKTTAGHERLQEKAVASRRSLEGAFSRLAAVMEPEALTTAAQEENALLVASRLVGQAINVRIHSHPNIQKGISRNPLGDIAKASRIRLRQVALKGEWWRQDNGPLLAYMEEDKRPVALLPTTPRSYVLVDPAVPGRVRVTPDVATSLNSFAYTFYRPFSDRLLDALDLIRFGLWAAKGDLLMVVLMGIAIGLLGVFVPLATGIIVDRIIPGADRFQLWQISLALLVSAIAAALFQVTQSIAFLRLEGKMDVSLQAAVWDRLLSLPVAFFRNYTAGDLGSRAMSISTIRQTLSGTTVGSILAGIFSLFSFGLLFYYDTRLAWLATGLVVLAAGLTTAASYLQVHYQRQLVETQGRISGIVLQLITGIAKFRVAGAEERAFVYWAKAFSEQKRLAYQARSVANGLAVFSAVYPIVATMAIFAALAFSATAGLSTGQFLGFNAAFSQFLVATLQVSFALISTLSVIPIYERAKPILQTLPETDETKASPGELSGRIEINNVSFRYKENGPLILREVSLQVQPGEFIALVGPSGSGKSTLLRLLLGFETPESGAIYYDGQDLASLDIQEVRRQTGVVLQNGRLLTGTILENIIGSSLLTIDDAWEAARACGLDEDVKRMPMGLHTLVSEGGGTLSGGQRQRLLIARSVVTRPRILFFDEATSALDNRTQAIVSENLERLQATRVVIAHRLSTIINADHIFVMDGGRLVQSGTYRELMNQPGLFVDLARRQLT